MAKLARPEDPVTGRYVELAQKVREILRWGDPKNRLTLKEAATISGVSATSIGMMAGGDRASMELIIQFACGMEICPNALLAAAQYPQIASAPLIAHSRADMADAAPVLHAVEALITADNAYDDHHGAYGDGHAPESDEFHAWYREHYDEWLEHHDDLLEMREERLKGLRLAWAAFEKGGSDA
jgi:hypothetical protein